MNNDILIISYGKVKNHIFSKVSGTSSPIYSRFVQQAVAQIQKTQQQGVDKK